MATSNKPSQALVADKQVEQLERLLDGLSESVRSPRLIGPSADPQTALKAVLNDPTVTSLHVLGHGQPGSVRIGSRWLTPEDFRVNDDIAATRLEPLEILFWSCHTGAEARGKAFMQHVAEHSMANVFASTGLIGDSAQGGSWELNMATKPRANVPFTERATESFE
jgi:hypothetical protein